MCIRDRSLNLLPIYQPIVAPRRLHFLPGALPGTGPAQAVRPRRSPARPSPRLCFFHSCSAIWAILAFNSVFVACYQPLTTQRTMRASSRAAILFFIPRQRVSFFVHPPSQPHGIPTRFPRIAFLFQLLDQLCLCLLYTSRCV